METLKDKTAKGLFWGGLSNGLQQLLNIAFGIFLARMLDSSDYGLVGMLTIFSNIAATIQESGFTAALTNKRDATARDYNAVFWFSTLAGVTMYVVLFACAPLIASFFGHEELVPLSRVLFIGFVISSTGIAHNAILFRNMRVKETARISVASLAISGTVGVVMALCGMAYWSLVAQSLTFVSCVTLLRWHYSDWRPTLRIDFRPLKGMYAFSVKLFLTNIVNQVNNNIFSVILGRLYTPSDVGYYTQSNKWMSMGMQTVAGMTNGIAQPAFAQVGDDNERLCRVLHSLLRFTAFVSFPALFGLALIAPELITITIGEKWLPAVPLLRLLCLQGAIWPLNNIYNQMIISRGRSEIILWSAFIFGLCQIALALSLFRYGILAMVAAYAAAYVLMLVALQIIVNRIVGFTFSMALRSVVPYALCSVAVLGAVYFATLSVTNIYLLVALKIVMAAVLYVAIMKTCHSTVLDECLLFFRNKVLPK